MKEAPPSLLPVADLPDLDVRVRADRLHLLFRQSRPAVYTSVVVATLVCISVWQSVRHELLLGWMAAVVASSLVRAVIFWWHRRSQPEGLQILDWEVRYAVTLFVPALVWGLGVLWMMQETTLLQQVVMFTFLLGMSAGAASLYSARCYMAVGAMISVLLPATLWFLFQGQPTELALGIAALVFLGVLVHTSRTLSDAQGNNFRNIRLLDVAKLRAESMALTDELTRLDNRRAFFEHGQVLVNYCERNRLPLSVVMIDADHFKQINDRYGHAMGDVVLCNLALQLKLCLRKSDLCGRMGGEEFAMLLPDTPLAEATALAERFRLAYAAAPTRSGEVEIANTVSIGVSSGGYDLEHLLQRADQALYRAKAEGRNRVVSRPSVE